MTLTLITFLKVLFPNTVTWRVGASVFEFWVSTIQFITGTGSPLDSYRAERKHWSG